MGQRRDDLGCSVAALHYDFVNREGRLQIDPEDSWPPNERACLKLFEGIDPLVRYFSIKAASGGEDYRKQGDVWVPVYEDGYREI